MFYKSNVKFQVALDKVLFDIRKTPNAMTGFTPFQATFNSPMRTDFSYLTEVPTEVTSEPRNIEKEYFRPTSRTVPYKEGDRVFYRYGAKQPFKGVGKIVKLAGSDAYKVLTDRGYTRIYNQSNLKLRYDDTEPDLDAEIEAYDSVVLDDNTEVAPKQVIRQQVPKPRYNLRQRTVTPKT